ncbi:MAG: hypothetical protein ACFE96_15800 [Candidatus Hermodarchaeota archaeon]
MLYVLYIPGYSIFIIFLTCNVALVINMIIGSFFNLKKNRNSKEEDVILVLWALMVILAPILILIIPNLAGHWGGYIFASVILLWDSAFIIILFLIILSLIYRKKSQSIKEEAGTMKSIDVRNVSNRILDSGPTIICISVSVQIFLSFLRLNITSIIILWDNPSIFLILAILILILITGIYSISLKKYFTFGSLICIIGGITMIIYPIFNEILWSYYLDNYIIYIIAITQGSISIIGVILHYARIKIGCSLCFFLGLTGITINFLILGSFYSILLMYYTYFQIYPILMMIGGYIQYKELKKS